MLSIPACCSAKEQESPEEVSDIPLQPRSCPPRGTLLAGGSLQLGAEGWHNSAALATLLDGYRAVFRTPCSAVGWAAGTGHRLSTECWWKGLLQRAGSLSPLAARQVRRLSKDDFPTKKLVVE